MSEPINDIPNSNESIPDLNTNQSVKPNPFITNATEVEPVIEEQPVIEELYQLLIFLIKMVNGKRTKMVKK